MKRILVVCGTGVATSTVVVGKIREHLKSRGVEADIQQGKVMDLVRGEVDADNAAGRQGLRLPRLPGVPRRRDV